MLRGDGQADEGEGPATGHITNAHHHVDVQRAHVGAHVKPPTDL